MYFETPEFRKENPSGSWLASAPNRGTQRCFSRFPATVLESSEEAQIADQEEEDQLFVATCFTSSESIESWLIDRGCTNHMTNDKELFKDLKPTNINGAYISVKGKGTVAITSCSDTFFKQDTYMAPSSRLRPRSAPVSARLSTDTALPPTDVISSPCIPTPSSHMDCNSVGSTSRRGRGPTKGFRSERARAKTGGKLLVHFKNNVPIGINASDFVSEIGLQVRNVAPVRGVRRWKEIPADVRQVIQARVFTKYEVVDYDTSDDVRVAVDRKFQARYRDWRSSMHIHYKNCSKKEIDPKTVPFSGVEKDDWVWVIENVYEDEKFHERSMKNIENRKRLPYNHCMGSKSFQAAMHALANPETGEEPHIVDFYRESHYSKKKDKWIDQQCQEIHEKLVAEREKCTQEGAIQLTQEQISINVLGGRSGYLRGFGNGPKPTSTTRSTRIDLDDGERGALRATVERLQNELGARSEEIEQMKNNQVAMQRQMEEMMRLVARVTGSDMMTQGGVLTS